jgi:hypothetical protein
MGMKNEKLDACSLKPAASSSMQQPLCPLNPHPGPLLKEREKIIKNLKALPL